jgi:hypothetical protein
LQQRQKPSLRQPISQCSPSLPGRTETTVSGTDYNFNTNATLAPGTYGDINVQNGQTLTLGAGIYNMANFTTGQPVTINVSPDTVLMIDGLFNISDGGTSGQFPGYMLVPTVLLG